MIIQLIQGAVEFQKRMPKEINALYDRLSEGQDPDIFLLTCADSRLMPELLTQAKPGVLFTQRNVGNLVPSYDSPPASEKAALEYVLKKTNVHNIIICGHSDCGAMKISLLPTLNPELPDINDWVYAQACSSQTMVELVEDKNDSELVTRAKRNIIYQMDKLKSYPLVEEKLKNGDLTLHGWYFDIQLKSVFIYEPTCKQFIDLNSALNYAIAARREKIVNTCVLNYLKNLPPPVDASQYEARRELLRELHSKNLKSIWNNIKPSVTDALWNELLGLYPNRGDEQFELLVETAIEMKIKDLDKKTLLKELTTSNGYYAFCRSAPRTFDRATTSCIPQDEASQHNGVTANFSNSPL